MEETIHPCTPPLKKLEEIQKQLAGIDKQLLSVEDSKKLKAINVQIAFVKKVQKAV